MEEKNSREQSSSWDFYEDLIKSNPGNRLEGFPFKTEFPTLYGGQNYEIILVSGEKVIASVDDSQEYMAEGLQWRKKSGGNSNGSAVAAWKRIKIIENI